MSEPLTQEELKQVLKSHEEDIMALKENNGNVMKALTTLEEGQADIENRLEKGDERMGNIEAKMDNSDKKRDEQHSEVLKKIDDKEMKELRDELRLRKDVSGKIVVGLVVLAAGTLISYIAWSFGKISGVQ
jgi:chromosome segregation ATPase